MIIVGCRFTDYGKIYNYKTDDVNIQVDDHAVIKNQNTGKFSIVRIVEIRDLDYELDPDINYTWLVQRIDTDHYEELCNGDTI